MKLQVSGIDSIRNRIRAMQSGLDTKMNEILRILAERGMNVAQSGFGNAQYDGNNDVSVSVEWGDDNSVSVVARGRALLFIEFGTGITYGVNHPLAGQYGAERGKYGSGHGSSPNGWHYHGQAGTNGVVEEDGRWKGYVHTYGNPPAEAMYNAGKTMRSEIESIILEVFAK